jgi:serine/threonine-protein phosphatase 2A regulatory subunit B
MSSRWKIQQSFGANVGLEDLADGNHITSLDFNEDGKYLATGDSSGKIQIYREKVNNMSPSRSFFSSSKSKPSQEYEVHGEFQSHEAEFDYLKSIEIEEKINQIRWIKRCSSSLQLLSTNDKTIKLWKIHEKEYKELSCKNIVNGTQRVKSLVVPKLVVSGESFAAKPRKVYANAHTYHINSISMNSDNELYLSADDLRINLWDLSDSSTCFNIVDMKPDNMEDLAEVITSAEFHPSQCNIFMYSTSGGSIKLGDMRGSAICDVHSKSYAETESAAGRSFFSEIISSISDVKFTRDGTHIISRDYLTLKLWDLRFESKAVRTINIHDYLRDKLVDLYENDCIFDKFEIAVSGDGKSFVTGSYGNYFHIYDRFSEGDEVVKAGHFKSSRSKSIMGKRKDIPPGIDVNTMNFSEKVIHSSWHPCQNTIAVASLNNLYICNAP